MCMIMPCMMHHISEAAFRNLTDAKSWFVVSRLIIYGWEKEKVPLRVFAKCELGTYSTSVFS
jgi:hypothetical protein